MESSGLLRRSLRTLHEPEVKSLKMLNTVAVMDLVAAAVVVRGCHFAVMWMSQCKGIMCNRWCMELQHSYRRGTMEKHHGMTCVLPVRVAMFT